MYTYTKKIAILVAVLCLGFFFAKVYQPAGKTVRIYKNALKDYENESYSNSYYLFSKVGYLSSLKPVAIYRQALCAKALGDKKTELMSYQRLIKHYPASSLAIEAKYQAGQMIVTTHPRLARKYFDKVLKTSKNSDYKLASAYFIAKIDSERVKYFENSKKSEKIVQAFREYLLTAPGGRLAVDVAKSWENFNPNLSTDDAYLVAKAYYLAEMYDEAFLELKDIDKSQSWALLSAVDFAKNNNEEGRSLVEEGVSAFPDSVTAEDYKTAVEHYLTSYNNTAQISNLFTIAKGKNKAYLWNLKCEASPKSEKKACYSSLYASNPEGDYAQQALLQLFYLVRDEKNYAEIKRIAYDYIEKFPNSDAAPEVMFWAGKAQLRYSHQAEAFNLFQDIIKKYPDSYYAYRSFWLLKNIKPILLNTSLEYKPVVYPYKHPVKGTLLYTLLSVGDYDLLAKVSGDEFIRSWAEHKKGNYSTSAIIARDAMAALEEKPIKDDLRWRLVYPQNYYIQVHKYASKNNNNDSLIMSIIREESHFNSEAQSEVGAIGLMQLMPATAHEIGEQNGITFNTNYLLNPELNINLGNLYFSALKKMLSGNEIYAIAAYNGGVGSVNNWISGAKINDIDEFVEQIPYPETKNYVKKVFRSYWNYSRIYQQQ